MAFDLIARLRIVDEATAPLRKATSEINRFNSTVQQSSRSIGLFGNSGRSALNGIKNAAVETATRMGIIASAAAGVGAAFSGIKKTMDFEAELSTIKALTGASSAEMQKMSNLAIQMGAKTKYSALEAAQGIEELLKAGLSPAQVQAGGLEAALNLATAGGLRLADAAEIMSTALNAFKADGMKAADAANILAGTANASATDVEELKFSLSQVSAVASGVGLSFRDTNAALGVFANNGLKGSDAGTSLKTMLMNLQPSTKAQIEEFQQLGLMTFDAAKGMKILRDNGIKPLGSDFGTVSKQLMQLAAQLTGTKVGSQKAQQEYIKLAMQTGVMNSAFYDANGHLKSMSQIAGILRKALSGMTDAQRQAALYTMFGSDAIRAANILYKEGSGGIKKFIKEMSKVTALDVAREKMNNASGAVEQFKGAMETLQIAVLMPLMPVIKDAANAMADWVSKLKPSQINAFGNTIKTAFQTAFSILKNVFGFISGHWGAVSTILVSLAAGAITLKAGLTGLTIISTITKLMRVYREATLAATLAEMGLNTALLLNPWTWVIAGIAALVAAAVAIYKNWGPIKAWFINLWHGISEATLNIIHSMINGIISIYHSIVGGVSSALNFVKSVSINIWNGIVAGIMVVVKPIVNAVLTVFNQMKPGLTMIFNGVKAVIQGAWTIIKNIVLGSVILIYDLVTGNFRRLFIDAVGIFNNLRGAINLIWIGIKTIFHGYVSAISGEVRGIFMVMAKAVSTILHGIWNVIKSIWTGIKNFIFNIIPSIANYVMKGWNTLWSGTSSWMGRVKKAVSDKFNEIVKDAKSLPGKIGKGILDYAGSAYNAIGKMANKLIDKFREILGIHSPSRVFTEMGGHIVQGLINGLSTADLKQFGMSVLKDFGGGVLKGWNAVKSVLTGLLGGGSSGDVTSWLAAALGITGTPMSWLPGLQKLVSAESGGNPNAINRTPVLGQHATGLLQMLPSTFRSYMLPGLGNIFNPIHNAVAAIRYIKSRYGSVYNTPLFKGGPYKGYYHGLERVPYDRYPALLHKDEAVLTRQEADRWRKGQLQPASATSVVVDENTSPVSQTINISKLADYFVIREESDIDKITDQLAIKIKAAWEAGA